MAEILGTTTMMERKTEMAESSTIGDFLEARATRRPSENLEQRQEAARRHLHWSDVIIICVALAALIGASLHVSPAPARHDGPAIKVTQEG
jgi:hypothetical protein